jgi:hypothetical protein
VGGLRERAIRNGRADPGPYQGPNVPGLAPKTARYMYGMIGGSNVVVPDTHFVRHLFGLDKVQDGPTSEYLKNVLWSPASGHVLDGIDRFYEKNHPAVQHVKQHPEIGRMLPEGEGGAIFPAFWRHWLAIAPHEASRGMGQANLAFNQATTHEPYWEAISPYVRKSESPAAPPPEGSLAEQTAEQHLRWVEQYGELPALTLYYANLVPKLLGDDQPAPAKDPGALVRKLESLSVELRSLARPLRKGAAPTERWPHDNEDVEVEFGGRRVRPGKLRAGGVSYSLLAAEPGRFVAVPEEKLRDYQASDVVSIPAKSGAWIGSYPEVVDEGTVVDPDKHGDPLNRHPEQRDLVTGLDFGAPPPGAGGMPDRSGVSDGGWRRHPSGAHVYVKHAGRYFSPDPAEDGSFSDPHREVAYHNLAKDFFGLGQYIQPTAMVRHPRTGEEHVVVAGVRGGEHHGEGGSDALARHGAELRRLADSGDMDKLMVMNSVLGNQDRHQGNYLHSPDGVKMIDHGLAFEDQAASSFVPAYVRDYSASSSKHQSSRPMHPGAVKWVHSLDEGELARHLSENRVPEKHAAGALYRLRNLKAHLTQHPDLSREKTWQAPSFDHSQGVTYVNRDPAPLP